MSKANLESKLALLEESPLEMIKVPSNMPVAVYIREAEAMLAAGRRDLGELEAVGFEAEWLDDLAVRIGALRQAESRLKMGLGRLEGDGKKWPELSKLGFGRLKSLKATLLFAYRGDKLLTKTVREAVTGRSAHAMVQGLYNLAAIGRANPGPLEVMRFDLAELERISALSERLGKVLGAVDAERAAAYKPGRLRNAAFTHLQEGLKELRDYALYVFRDDELKSADYNSDFLRKRRVKRKMRAAVAGDVLENEFVAGVKVVKSAELSGHKQALPGEKLPVAGAMAFTREEREQKCGARPGKQGLKSAGDGKDARSEGRERPGLRMSGEERRMNEPEVRREPLHRPLEEGGGAYEPLARAVREARETVGLVFDVGFEDKNGGEGHSDGGFEATDEVREL